MPHADPEERRRYRKAYMRAKRAQLGSELKAKEAAWSAAYYRANRQKRVQNALSWNKANPDSHRSSSRKWRKNHPEKDREYGHVKHSRRRSAKGQFTLADWRSLVGRSPRCYWCRRTWTVARKPTHDHVIALSNGGDNSPENSVCACKECNSRKGNRTFHPINGQGILL